MHLDAIDEPNLNERQNRDIEALLLSLKDSASVTKTLQSDNTSLADVRSIFDSVSDYYPETCVQLAKDAAIVFDLVFESAVMKVIEVHFGEISVDEIQSIN